MNRMGALINLLLAIGIGFIIWKALDERLGVIERIVIRFRLLRQKPWAVMAVMLLCVVPLGFIFMMLRLPEVVYYTLSGLIIISALTLFEGAREYAGDEPLTEPADTQPEEAPAEETAPEEETPSEEKPEEPSPDDGEAPEEVSEEVPDEEPEAPEEAEPSDDTPE